MTDSIADAMWKVTIAASSALDHISSVERSLIDIGQDRSHYRIHIVSLASVRVFLCVISKGSESEFTRARSRIPIFCLLIFLVHFTRGPSIPLERYTFAWNCFIYLFFSFGCCYSCPRSIMIFICYCCFCIECTHHTYMYNQIRLNYMDVGRPFQDYSIGRCLFSRANLHNVTISLALSFTRSLSHLNARSSSSWILLRTSEWASDRGYSVCLFIVPTENYNFGWIFISSSYDYLFTAAAAAATFVHREGWETEKRKRPIE